MLITTNFSGNFSSRQKNNINKTNIVCPQNSHPAYKSLYTDIRMNKNNAGVFFAGLHFTEKLITPVYLNKTGHHQCDTFFFRDLSTLNTMKAYLPNHFPEGTHIADFGCSKGEETRTIEMLLSDINQDKRYTITGYDPSIGRISEANEGIYHIGMNEDNFLLTNISELMPGGKKLKKLFNEYFSKKPSQNKGGEKCFVAKVFKAIDSFRVGNIGYADELLKEKEIQEGKKTGVVIFKNGWYHIMQSNPGDFCTPDEYDNLNDLKTVLKKIHGVLPDNGILVTGSLPRDHILGAYAYNLDNGIIDTSPFHNALKECGFKPVEESATIVQPQVGAMDFIFYRNTQVYSIWKKVSETNK